MGKFEIEKEIVETILKKKALSPGDRRTLLRIYNVSYHDSGKIEGLFSCDSSCHGCTFCQRMMEAGKQNPDIICNYCYDCKLENRWKNVLNRHGLNMRIMSSVDFSIEELSILPINGMCRINSSGDIENDTHARNMVRLAYAFPDIRFALWAKNVPAVEAAFDESGKPRNMKFIQSSPVIGARMILNKYADNTFTVYRKDQIEQALATGSMECNGRKCKDCGFKCYKANGWKKGTDIAEVLR